MFQWRESVIIYFYKKGNYTKKSICIRPMWILYLSPLDQVSSLPPPPLSNRTLPPCSPRSTSSAARWGWRGACRGLNRPIRRSRRIRSVWKVRRRCGRRGCWCSSWSRRPPSRGRRRRRHLHVQKATWWGCWRWCQWCRWWKCPAPGCLSSWNPRGRWQCRWRRSAATWSDADCVPGPVPSKACPPWAPSRRHSGPRPGVAAAADSRRMESRCTLSRQQPAVTKLESCLLFWSL